MTVAESVGEQRAKDLLQRQLEPNKKNRAREGQKLQPATEPLKPFAPFSWDDDILLAVRKLNALPGVDRVTMGDGSGTELDVRHIETKEHLETLLQKYVRESAYSRGDIDTLISLNITGEYLDKMGSQRLYHKAFMYLSARPVIISGTPFELTVAFAGNPGLAVAHPDKVLTANVVSRTSKTPLALDFSGVMMKVDLISDSVILNETLPSIERLLEDKYRRYDPNHHYIHEWRNGGTLHTNENQNLLTVYGPHPFGLEYSSEALARSLAQRYLNHVANLESQQFKGKKDMKEGL
ncbi:hypothetical protein [Nitrospira moscoviensis]|uniref:hypothetical protein n=1 Tax=Nitrospira moscoviensis TaxID=42253 RepID=UPI0011AE5D79|nr:hypothetical protein [Nitrospira moscoviensis]